MKRLLALSSTLALVVAGPTFATTSLIAAESKPIFEQDFSQADPGKVPDEFLVLDGLFAVKEESGNRFLELPGAPLENFGALFGPNEVSGVQVAARGFSTRQGRKFPVFGVGLNGVTGYKLQVAPAKNALELLKGDDVKATLPFAWKSGEWTWFKLQVRKTATGSGFRLEGKAWQGDAEPKDWTLTLDDSEGAPPGKAGIWAMPFAGTPIRFDDLKLIPAQQPP